MLLQSKGIQPCTLVETSHSGLSLSLSSFCWRLRYRRRVCVCLQPDNICDCVGTLQPFVFKSLAGLKQLGSSNFKQLRLQHLILKFPLNPIPTLISVKASTYKSAILSTAFPKFSPFNIPTNPSALFSIPSVTLICTLISPSLIQRCIFFRCSSLYFGPKSGSNTMKPRSVSRLPTTRGMFLMP